MVDYASPVYYANPPMPGAFPSSPLRMQRRGRKGLSFELNRTFSLTPLLNNIKRLPIRPYLMIDFFLERRECRLEFKVDKISWLVRTCKKTLRSFTINVSKIWGRDLERFWARILEEFEAWRSEDGFDLVVRLRDLESGVDVGDDTAVRSSRVEMEANV